MQVHVQSENFAGCNYARGVAKKGRHVKEVVVLRDPLTASRHVMIVVVVVVVGGGYTEGPNL